MTDDTTRQPDPVKAALDGVDLRPASEARGVPGHDTADAMMRGARLIQLRAARMTYEQIAQQLGYADRSTARQALMRALERHEAENAVELRALENVALDSDERALRTIISDPKRPDGERIRAIDARTRLSARRSRLNGLDAPVQVQLSAGIEADLADALAEAEQVFGQVLSVEDERLEG